MSIVFGPVPSRRLGRSLGINNIPPKVCSYSCVYCQVGRTSDCTIRRREFYSPDSIASAVRERVSQLRDSGEAIDYLTFVPDGEPTLDVRLGEEIDRLRPLAIPVAVITNASLLWRPEVRSELDRADWVSVKVDAATPEVWERVQRPHRELSFDQVRGGLRAFAASFPGTLATETMLVRGVNDSAEHVAQVAELAAEIRPSVAFVAIPTRPPSEPWVVPPDEATVNRAVQAMKARVPSVEYLIGHEGTAFSGSGDAAQDILNITAVHPLRDDAAQELLTRNHADRAVLRSLLDAGELVETAYLGQTFYVRRFKRDVGVTSP